MSGPQNPSPASVTTAGTHGWLHQQALAPDIDWLDTRGRFDWKRSVGENARRLWHTFSDEQKLALAIDAENAANLHDFLD